LLGLEGTGGGQDRSLLSTRTKASFIGNPLGRIGPSCAARVAGMARGWAFELPHQAVRAGDGLTFMDGGG
jgi:hypothetical protein